MILGLVVTVLVAVLIHVVLDFLYRRLRRSIRASAKENRALLDRVGAALVELRAENDRFQAYRAAQDRAVRRNERLVALWAAATEDPSSVEAAEARADAAELARWN